ncbi:phage portal protein [Falsiroseomonas sp.]|uniref:phage portal protein n=1 Tax=Falsiroseomonas sp. TaxID=2870721 RepID=UPI0035675C9E
MRDVSWLAPVLLRLRDLGDYEAALLMKAKIEACLAAVVTEEGDEALTGVPPACSATPRAARSRASSRA